MKQEVVNRLVSEATTDILGVAVLDKNKLIELVVNECVARINGCHLAEGYDTTIVGDYEVGYGRAVSKCAWQVQALFGLDNAD